MSDQPEEVQGSNPPPQKKQRVSPAVILFLISGILGLGAAGIMLLFEGEGTGAYETFESLTAPRAVREWEAPDTPIQTLEGETVSLTDYQGRVIFLNFWWTGCPPCVRELPALQAFNEAQGEDGAVVLAINQGEDADDVSAFLDELGVSGITVLMDQGRNWGDQFGISGFPTTYIIDAQGMVRYLKLGELDIETMNEYVDAVSEPEAATQG